MKGEIEIVIYCYCNIFDCGPLMYIYTIGRTRQNIFHLQEWNGASKLKKKKTEVDSENGSLHKIELNL